MVTWTAELDEKLKALRAGGYTWDGVALEMGYGRNTVLERGRRIGARKLRPVPAFVAVRSRWTGRRGRRGIRRHGD